MMSVVVNTLNNKKAHDQNVQTDFGGFNQFARVNVCR